MTRVVGAAYVGGGFHWEQAIGAGILAFLIAMWITSLRSESAELAALGHFSDANDPR